MKLWYSPASPFVRKVLLLAHEAGLQDRVKRHNVSTGVTTPDAGLKSENPLGKLPTLVTDDGTVLFDSRVICAYLDTLHDGKKFLPRSGPKRFEVMTMEALGDGIMDAAVANRYETAARPKELQWQAWSDGQMGKVMDALDLLESGWVKKLGRSPNMGAFAVAAALGYLDFRYPQLNWRRGRRKLAGWFRKFSERPSYQATRPE